MSHNAESSDNNSEEGKHSSSENEMVPAYMSAVLRRQFLRQMVKCLPQPVQDRIVVTKNIQLEYMQLESEFFKEVYELEKKYHDKFMPLLEKRNEIVSGVVEPPKEEPKWKQHENDEEEDGEEGDKEANKQDFAAALKKFKDMPAGTKGIPHFWLTIFRNTELLSQMVQDHDIPLLMALNDIKIRYEDDSSYTLEFHFDKNDYFTNSVLTKQYWLRFAMDEEFPFGFDGPEIFKCKGCVINWKTKMNLTVKTIRKKQKHKEHGAVRTLVKTVANETFFNFFNPPELSGDKAEIDEESQDLLSTDFEIGHFLRAQVIPHAILYYTGDILDDEDDEDDYDDEEEDEDEEGGYSRNYFSHGEGGGKSARAGKPNECPNQ